MRVVCPGLLILVLATAVVAHPGNPQTPQTPQIPVFRAGVEMVRVDVYPRKNGKVVEGLTRDDFQLTEDGVRQTIDTFEFIPIDMDPSLEPLDPRSPSEAQRMATDPRNRVFVFYLDTYEITMEGSYRARAPLLEFLQRSMGPRDLFAWMTPKQLPENLEFTRMTQDLATLMTVVKPWGEKDTPVEDPYELQLQACAPPPPKARGVPAPPGAPNFYVLQKRRLKAMYDVRTLIVRLGALRAERKNLVILGERWQTTTDPYLRRDRIETPHSPAFHDAGIQRGAGTFKPPVSKTAEFCAGVMGYLARMFAYDTRYTLVELARRNNVALYFVSLAPVNLFNFSIARQYAQETDGQSFVSNDITQSLHGVLEHQTGFYMLGYRSTAGEAGRKERLVRVRTRRSGVDLDVRRVYEPPPPEFVASRSLPRSPIVRSDIQRALDRLPIERLDKELAMQAVARSGAVDVTVELMPRLAASDPWRTGGRVSFALRDESGAVVAGAEASFAAGERSARVHIPFGDGQRVARASVQIVHSAGFTLSDTEPIQPTTAAPIGGALMARAGSLPKLPFVPAALPAFARTDRMRIEWPVTGVLLDPAVRLLNAGGEPIATDATVGLADNVLHAELRLTPLAPGDYVIEATGHVAGKPVRDLVAFRVTR